MSKNDAVVLIDQTHSLCPLCEQFVPADIVVEDSRVYLRKRCPQHGEMDALLHSNAAQYLAGRRPDKRHELVATGDLTTTPDQAVCVVVIDVTDACNLRCPTCFAAAEGHNFISREDFERALDTALAHSPNLSWLQLSGGEPTIHPHILDFVHLAQARGVRVVQINTNGVRIARDDHFLVELAEVRPSIYLSFDTFRPPAYKELRGANLVDVKLKAMERLAAHEIGVSVVCTVQRGVNEGELGDIVRFGMQHPNVASVVFQPTFYAGRAPDHNPLERITNGDVLRFIEEQMDGAICASDFVPVPCCNPACTAITFVYQDGETIVPLTRLVNLADYEEYLRDRLVDPDILDLLNSMNDALC